MEQNSTTKPEEFPSRKGAGDQGQVIKKQSHLRRATQTN